jgi:hypothetical protein
MLPEASHFFSHQWATFRIFCAHVLHAITSGYEGRPGDKASHTIHLVWDFRFSLQRVWSSESSGITLMIAAAGTSETSVDIYLTTWQYIPQDSELHSSCVLW